MEALLAYLRANALELFGFVTGAACVWLLARQNIWNWPVGILNNLTLLVVLGSHRLFAEMSLQVVFAVIGAYGWWHWLHGGTDHAQLRVSRTPRREATLLAVATAIGVVAAIWALQRFTTSSTPIPDTTATGLSVAAMVLQARKRLENWWLWIVSNVISISLFTVKGLYITSGLYAVMLAMSVAGLLEWTRSYRQESP